MILLLKSNAMNEVLTVAEIKSKYDSEWVLIEDPVTDKHLNVLSGTVLWHSKDRDEVYRKALELKPAHSAILFTGKIPEGTAVIL